MIIKVLDHYLKKHLIYFAVELKVQRVFNYL